MKTILILTLLASDGNVVDNFPVIKHYEGNQILQCQLDAKHWASKFEDNPDVGTFWSCESGTWLIESDHFTN